MKKYNIIILILLFFVSCYNRIGDKVYLEFCDDGFKLHINKKCSDINKKHLIKYMDVKDWADEYSENKDYIFFCTKCVSDENADYLNGLLKDNPDTIIATTHGRRDDLYMNLRDAGIGEDVIGTEDDFYNFISPDFQ